MMKCSRVLPALVPLYPPRGAPPLPIPSLVSLSPLPLQGGLQRQLRRGRLAVGPATATTNTARRHYTSIPIRRHDPRTQRTPRCPHSPGTAEPTAHTTEGGGSDVGPSAATTSIPPPDPQPLSAAFARGSPFEAEDWSMSLTRDARADGLAFFSSYDYCCDEEGAAGTSPSSSSGSGPRTGSDAVEALAALPTEVRVPRILFLGGDVVSLTSLEALHERMEAIVRHAFAMQEEVERLESAIATEEGSSGACCGSTSNSIGSSSSYSHDSEFDLLGERATPRRRRLLNRCRQLRRSRYAVKGDLPPDSPEARRVQAFIRDHLTVVCPYLPHNITPEEAARKYSRQYPVARYAVQRGLSVIPVDHPKSLAKSQLLRDMLGDKGTAGSGEHGAASAWWLDRDRKQRAERERRRRCETWCGRVQQVLEDRCGGYTAAASAPPVTGMWNYSLSCLLPSSWASTRVAGVGGSPQPSTPLPPPPPLPQPQSPDFSVSTPWMRQGRPLKDFDLAVVVSFRYFIPARLLEALPPTVNMHPSLLPFYRGASPLFSTLMRNESMAGVSIIQLRAGQTMMDSGNVLYQCRIPLRKDVDIRVYLPLATQLGAAGLCDTIFGEQPGRTQVWCSRLNRFTLAPAAAGEAPEEQQQATAVASSSSSSSSLLSPPQPPVAPLPLPPPFITPHVIRAAIAVHRRYAQYRAHVAATGTVPSSPSAPQREVRCSDVFPLSVRNSYCDWPDTFWFNWRTAAVQQYETYPHFSQDPYHAPLLPRDAAVLRFSSFTGTQAYGVWRAFVGGQYFQPAVNATLDKSCTPVRNQLSKRTLRRLVRERIKALAKRHGKQQQQQQQPGAKGQGISSGDASVLADAPGGASAVPDVEEGGRQSTTASAGERGNTTQSKENHTKNRKGTSPEAKRGNSIGNANMESQQAPAGGGSCGGGKPRRRKTQKLTPIDLSAAAAVIDTAMLQAVDADLRLICTFTKALHPDLVPQAVLAEIALVEQGRLGGGGESGTDISGLGSGAVATAATTTGHVRFFRQPAALFSSTQIALKVKEALAVRRRRREEVKDGTVTVSRLLLSASYGAMFERAMRVFLPASMTDGERPSPVNSGVAGQPDATGTPDTTTTAAEAEDEDEEDAVSTQEETGIVILKTPELRMALSGSEEDDDDDDGTGDGGGGSGSGGGGRPAASDEEEAPEGYVPDVILAAPPSSLPWMADIGEELGFAYLDSQSGSDSSGNGVATGAGPTGTSAMVMAGPTRGPAEAACPSKGMASADFGQSSHEPASATASDGGNEAPSQEAAAYRGSNAWRKLRQTEFYIPPGTAYFPVCDEGIGAIKCREGWFYWSEAHLKAAPRAQPVVLLRKGMAMRTGILYAGLFSEYCK